MFLTPPTGWKKPLTSVLVGSDAGRGKAWASVARYDDKYVEELKQRGGAGQGVSGDITWGGVAADGQFDTHKMFKSCGKMVADETPEEWQGDVSVLQRYSADVSNVSSTISRPKPLMENH
jgi:phosphatidylinositol-3,4,5-trisphosphate 3-phosphatase/dual-specificity protein phosphatase PTEN